MHGRFLRRYSRPTLKIFENDELQSDVLNLILHNSRMPTHGTAVTLMP